MSLDPLTAGIDFATTLINKFIQDPGAKDAAKLELLKMQESGELARMANDTQFALAQIGTNTEEAKSTNLFVSGGRPFIIWICGIALGYATIIEPCMRFVANVYFHYSGAFPVIDTMLTFQLLLALLGLGGMRSWEKGKGVAS